MEQIGKTILRFSSNPVLDVSKFFEVALFSFITGNADMHLKNFSLIRLDNKMTALAPAYDLLATRLLIPEQDDPEEMALTLNGKKSRLHFSDFYKFGKTVGLNSKQVENSFKRFARFMPAALDFLKNAFIERERITAFKDLISERAARLKIT